MSFTVYAAGLMILDEHFINSAFPYEYLHSFNLPQWQFIGESLQTAETENSDVTFTSSEIALVFSFINRIAKTILSDDAERMHVLLTRRLQLETIWQAEYLRFAQWTLTSCGEILSEHPEFENFIESCTG